MVYYFLEGGAFMWPILLTLLFGLAFVIERAYSLMMSAVDSQTFFESVSQSIKESGTDAAVQVCSETEGPVASIFHAGLSKMSRGLDEVEKAIQNAGAIEMAFLEKNMIWLNAVITIAPMLGFTGTVVGMIAAFDAIKAANDSCCCCRRDISSASDNCIWSNCCYDNSNLSKRFCSED